jgi:DMSO reductase anchor subunit
VIAGIGALWLMYRAYCIAARPFWNHWQALATFFGNMLTLGALALAVLIAALTLADGGVFRGVPLYLGVPMFVGLGLEAVGLVFHARDLRRQGGETATAPSMARGPRLGPIGEGAASHFEQTTTFGFTYRARNIAVGVAAFAVAALTLGGVGGAWGVALWLLTALAILAASIVGRLLFYALVIPTTMPGAFFWRNRGFEQHARETGLAAMPQVGVVMNGH